MTLGDVVAASHMLGRPYRVISQVDTPVPPPLWPAEESSDKSQTVTIGLKHNCNLMPAPGRYLVHTTLKSRAQVEVSSCEAARRSLLRLDTELWVDAYITIRDERSVEMSAETHAQLVRRVAGEDQGGDMLLLLEFVGGE